MITSVLGKIIKLYSKDKKLLDPLYYYELAQNKPTIAQANAVVSKLADTQMSQGQFHIMWTKYTTSYALHTKMTSKRHCVIE